MATKAAAKAKKEFWATGRRKTAIARVRLLPGSGTVSLNEKPMEQYFGREALQLAVNQPFQVTGTVAKFDVAARIDGGGTSAQAQAVQHGISRALIAMNPDLRKPLKMSGLLTRDSREKERRKVGRRKARKRPQYSKR
ncbi:MAG: 30S ribosomal protein S9 [Deltaproteobacteria bacterium RIFCSPLOWO2_12_FULL_44_12]|nr:MAG: 30S ribosomal protein S9 [Deltaproteobacteria bacterium RIFCSPHIGHO2_01_FULL_43_49]OGQ16302.1 MAG: 30S ribosomal protein S9 [Deltaproteobacteria bacterium RIFCSPHIGHO2_02_FULL_44_53]OGQ29262.1 MAG: 30S ribosomal protein S9 [Deltaproteobacteria bacterium RIFCSPHIGHO2_12_FULL_44_21]OGQ32819.1 MAG: 30S ribosomal protein S9 [Deltaproteobacteria bacterium RIFCSPLOWO2_01_FULL_45_74]OGQ41920.1 MAG: 30S ribosomal protein S9 [Deltaproteobacteria bacterium RIFCSPLOWO2_02_FULL_44_34]OGQ71609.1 MA